MGLKSMKLRPPARLFRSRDQRAAFFRGMGKRTDRKARRNRELWELDQRRIEAGPLASREPLPSQPDARQAER